MPSASTGGNLYGDLLLSEEVSVVGVQLERVTEVYGNRYLALADAVGYDLAGGQHPGGSSQMDGNRMDIDSDD